MAHCGNNSGDPHLQVGSRLTRTLIAVLVISVLTATPALAATAEPTVKATASAKPTATAKATASAKPTATKKATPTKKAPKKKVRVSPSPKPVWPPKGFVAEGDVYAKIPTSKELVGIISASKSLALQIKDCEEFICGSVQVASATGCTWWEVVTDTYGADNAKLGTLNSAHAVSKAREIKTIITVSPESALARGRGKVVSVICHREARDANVARVTYKKVETTP